MLETFINETKWSSSTHMSPSIFWCVKQPRGMHFENEGTLIWLCKVILCPKMPVLWAMDIKSKQQIFLQTNWNTEENSLLGLIICFPQPQQEQEKCSLWTWSLTKPNFLSLEAWMGQWSPVVSARDVTAFKIRFMTSLAWKWNCVPSLSFKWHNFWMKS